MLFVQKVGQDLERIVCSLGVEHDEHLSQLETIVLLLEDRRFFSHLGIDFLSIARETWRMCTLQRFGGASTIDMQFVRTRTGYKARTLRRKLYEMFLAYLLQTKMTKIEILRAYMNEVYLGVGLRGTSSAADAVFGKPVQSLSEHEAAFLAAMMVYPRPKAMSSKWMENVTRRARYGQRLFEKYGANYAVLKFNRPGRTSK